MTCRYDDTKISSSIGMTGVMVNASPPRGTDRLNQRLSIGTASSGLCGKRAAFTRSHRHFDMFDVPWRPPISAIARRRVRPSSVSHVSGSGVRTSSHQAVVARLDEVVHGLGDRLRRET